MNNIPHPDHLLASYNYALPTGAIAQTPSFPRDHARLLVIDETRAISHHHFFDLSQFLTPGDLLVFNDTKVIPARLFGYKTTGCKVEVLLIEAQTKDQWLALVKPGRRLPVGTKIYFSDELWAEAVARDGKTKGRILQFYYPPGRSMADLLEELGSLPLPPYITNRDTTPDQYQTVYAKVPGAVAAPTAGLHFTDRLLNQLQAQGIELAWLTLHVGIGTFRPVETPDIKNHTMHQEWINIPETVEQKIKATHDRGRRVIGVGTTVARALESTRGKAFQGQTDLMIYPGYEWQVLDGLITNFHLPRSSLLMLVASFLGKGGREFLLETYRIALEQNYRFYSFGDTNLILRGNNF